LSAQCTNKQCALLSTATPTLTPTSVPTENPTKYRLVGAGALCDVDEDCFSGVCDPNMLGVGGNCAGKVDDASKSHTGVLPALRPTDVTTTDVVLEAVNAILADSPTTAPTAVATSELTAATPTAEPTAATPSAEPTAATPSAAPTATTPTKLPSVSPTAPTAEETTQTILTQRELQMALHFVSSGTQFQNEGVSPPQDAQTVFMEIVRQEIAANDAFLADVSAHNLTVLYGPVTFVEDAASDPTVQNMITFDDDTEVKSEPKRYASDVRIHSTHTLYTLLIH
jgi:hypothetical protein